MCFWIFLLFPSLLKRYPNSVFQSHPEIIRWKIFLCSNWTWWLPLWFTFTWSTGKVILFRLLLNYGWEGRILKCCRVSWRRKDISDYKSAGFDLHRFSRFKPSVNARISKYQLRVKCLQLKCFSVSDLS